MSDEAASPPPPVQRKSTPWLYFHLSWFSNIISAANGSENVVEAGNAASEADAGADGKLQRQELCPCRSEANIQCLALINLTILLPGSKAEKMQIMVRPSLPLDELPTALLILWYRSLPRSRFTKSDSPLSTFRPRSNTHASTSSTVGTRSTTSSPSPKFPSSRKIPRLSSFRILTPKRRLASTSFASENSSAQLETAQRQPRVLSLVYLCLRPLQMVSKRQTTPRRMARKSWTRPL